MKINFLSIAKNVEDPKLQSLLNDFRDDIYSISDCIGQTSRDIDRIEEKINLIEKRLDRLSKILISGHSLESIEKALIKTLGE